MRNQVAFFSFFFSFSFSFIFIVRESHHKKQFFLITRAFPPRRDLEIR